VSSENSRNASQPASSPVSSTQRRTIKSFVLRQGRLTRAQQNALENNWQDYGIDFSAQFLDGATLFNNDNEVIVEIGRKMCRI